jgi:hypothetical protein
MDIHDHDLSSDNREVYRDNDLNVTTTTMNPVIMLSPQIEESFERPNESDFLSQRLMSQLESIRINTEIKSLLSR